MMKGHLPSFIFSKKLFLFSFFLFLFSGCSWQEYFVITNETTSPIEIEYELQQPNGFAIFNSRPFSYKLNSSGYIDWENTINPVDMDTSLLSVKLILPPKNAVIIGHLSNDNYKSHDQAFINARNFNLKRLSIRNGDQITKIIPDNFDTHFKKKDGYVIFRTK